MDIACVSIEALCGDGFGMDLGLDASEVLEDVEIIFGRDTATQNVFLIYGRERLNRIIGDLNAPSVDVLMVELDRQSDELNQVLALVQIAKHQCDYVEDQVPSVPYPPDLMSCFSLLSRAVEIASNARIGVYDCMYVALAEREGCELVTADQRLVTNLGSQFSIISIDSV